MTRKFNIVRLFKSWSRTNILLFVGVILISFNLRPGMTSVGAIVGLIQTDLGMTHTQMGILTTLPLIAFSTASLFTSRLTHRVGMEWSLMIGVVMIGLGTVLRGMGGIPLLYGATIVMGAGIAICNVALIPLIKSRLAHRAATVTAAYTLFMSLTAAFGSGVTAPMAIDWNLGWRGALMIWGALALITIPVWMLQLNGRYAPKNQGRANNDHRLNIWKYRRAWNITVFMGLQSFIFYVLASWGPEILIDKGFTIEESGWALFYMQIVSLPAVYFTPILADKPGNLSKMVVAMCVFFFLGFFMLLGQEKWMMYAALTIIAQSSGASISLAYYLINEATEESSITVRLSGMAQSFGYYIAAAGPVLVGWMFDLVRNWNTILIMFFAVLLLYTYFIVQSIRQGTIESDR